MDDDIKYPIIIKGLLVMVRRATPEDINEWSKQELRPKNPTRCTS